MLVNKMIHCYSRLCQPDCNIKRPFLYNSVWLSIINTELAYLKITINMLMNHSIIVSK